MREDAAAALRALVAGLNADRWRGRTYRAFWYWYDAQTAAIAGMATTAAEVDEIRDALLDVYADVDEGGYTVETERLDQVIALAD